MAENEIQNAENEQQEAQQPVFQMQRCYLKDASLEMPNAPQILMQRDAICAPREIPFVLPATPCLAGT